MTAKAARAGHRRPGTGASVCSRRSAPAGTTSSFRRNLIGSATSVLMRPRPAKPKMDGAVGADAVLDDRADLALEEHAHAHHLQGDQQDDEDAPWRRRWRRRRPCVTRAASRSSSASARATSRFSWYSALFTCITGAVPQLAEALDLLEREAAVGACARRADAEPALDRGAELVGAAQRARQVAADLEVPAALRLLPVHRVEGRRPTSPRRAAAPSARRRTPAPAATASRTRAARARASA